MRVASVTLTSQSFVAVRFTAKWGCRRVDLAFDFAVLLFNGNPCAWPYIEVAVMAWMTHRWTIGMPIKPCLMSGERASKEAKWPDMRGRLEPHNPWPGTSNSCVWFFFSFATFVSVSFRRGTKVQIFNVVGEHQWCAVRLFVWHKHYVCGSLYLTDVQLQWVIVAFFCWPLTPSTLNARHLFLS